jgi:hypothetical protein
MISIRGEIVRSGVVIVVVPMVVTTLVVELNTIESGSQTIQKMMASIR